MVDAVRTIARIRANDEDIKQMAMSHFNFVPGARESTSSPAASYLQAPGKQASRLDLAINGLLLHLGHSPRQFEYTPLCLFFSLTQIKNNRIRRKRLSFYLINAVTGHKKSFERMVRKNGDPRQTQAQPGDSTARGRPRIRDRERHWGANKLELISSIFEQQ